MRRQLTDISSDISVESGEHNRALGEVLGLAFVYDHLADGGGYRLVLLPCRCLCVWLSRGPLGRTKGMNDKVRVLCEENYEALADGARGTEHADFYFLAFRVVLCSVHGLWDACKTRQGELVVLCTRVKMKNSRPRILLAVRDVQNRPRRDPAPDRVTLPRHSPSLSTTMSTPSADAAAQLLYPANVQFNAARVYTIKFISACFAGAVAGTLGLESWLGFGLFLLSTLLTSACLYVKCKAKPAKYMAGGFWELVNPGQENMFSFLLVWTLFYGTPMTIHQSSTAHSSIHAGIVHGSYSRYQLPDNH